MKACDAIKHGDYILHNGTSWKVLAVGVTDEDTGKTYVHLASTKEFVEQKNGARPKQCAVWINVEPINGQVPT